jgi:hypothetical protein
MFALFALVAFLVVYNLFLARYRAGVAQDVEQSWLRFLEVSGHRVSGAGGLPIAAQAAQLAKLDMFAGEPAQYERHAGQHQFFACTRVRAVGRGARAVRVLVEPRAPRRRLLSHRREEPAPARQRASPLGNAVSSSVGWARADRPHGGAGAGHDSRRPFRSLRGAPARHEERSGDLGRAPAPRGSCRAHRDPDVADPGRLEADELLGCSKSGAASGVPQVLGAGAGASCRLSRGRNSPSIRIRSSLMCPDVGSENRIGIERP